MALDFGKLNVKDTGVEFQPDKPRGRTAEASPLQSYLTESKADNKARKVVLHTEDDAKDLVREVARAAKQLGIGYNKKIVQTHDFGKDQWVVIFQGADKRNYGGRRKATDAEVVGTGDATATETGF